MNNIYNVALKKKSELSIHRYKVKLASVFGIVTLNNVRSLLFSSQLFFATISLNPTSDYINIYN